MKQEKQKKNSELPHVGSFQWRFMNLDNETCWLNACLQLVLTAIDHSTSSVRFSSDLGLQLNALSSSDGSYPLDATAVKHILVATEDTLQGSQS